MVSLQTFTDNERARINSLLIIRKIKRPFRKNKNTNYAPKVESYEEYVFNQNEVFVKRTVTKSNKRFILNLC